MKRLFRIITLIIAMLSIPQIINAQRGEMTLGVGGGFASFNKSGYANIYFQYSFSKHVRISPQLGYIFRNEGMTGLGVSIDMHFPFKVAKAFSIYPLAGLTFNNWNKRNSDNNYTRFGGDVGAGLELYMTQNLKITLEGKYSIMKDTDGAYIGVGFGYVF